MKNAILIHGTGGRPDQFWFPYLRNLLENKGYAVWAPQVPNAERPELETSLPFFLDNGEFNSETVLIGHSSGCPTILSILERIEVSIAKAILVAGFYQPLDDSGSPNPILQPDYHWEFIRSRAKEIILINSDNDPWGCTDLKARPVMQKLRATLIVPAGQGHMGSEKFNQLYREFPLLARLI